VSFQFLDFWSIAYHPVSIPGAVAVVVVTTDRRPLRLFVRDSGQPIN
jgi:hypothetical protein